MSIDTRAAAGLLFIVGIGGMMTAVYGTASRPLAMSEEVAIITGTAGYALYSAGTILFLQSKLSFPWPVRSAAHALTGAAALTVVLWGTPSVDLQILARLILPALYALLPLAAISGWIEWVVQGRRMAYP